MTRKKLNLAYIANDSVRKATFNKRKKGVFKKVHELTVLCDIEACVVINSQFSPTPEVWPSVAGVNKAVERFLTLPEVDQMKKMVNHETFLKQSIDKTKENNIKRMKENAERTMKEAMFQYVGGKGDKLKLNDRNRVDLVMYIGQYLKLLYHHKDHTLTQRGESSSAMAPRVIPEVDPSSFSPANVMASRALTEVGSSSFSFANVIAPNAIAQEGSFSLAPNAIAQEGSFSLAPNAITEVGLSSLAPRTISEVGSSYFSFANVMTPGAMAEVGSSAFQNPGVLNSPPLTNDLWAIRSSDPKPEQVHTFNDQQQGYYLMMNQVGVYDQPFNPSQYQYQYQYQQPFGYPPVVGQDGMYYQNQNQNHQQFGFPPVMGQDGMYNLNQSQGEQLVNEMVNNPDQMGFHTMMDDNKQYYHQ